MDTIAFLMLRAVHVAFAAIWIGSTVFTSLLLVPAVEASGPAGGDVMAALGRRGMNAYMTAIGAGTLATGIYLLWRFTGGFDAAVIATHAGLAFATGGAAGVLAGVVGGGVVGRSATRLLALMTTAAAQPDEAAKAAVVGQAAALRGRMKAGARVVLALQAVALVLMALGHYI
jgi:hypothetical protein